MTYRQTITIKKELLDRIKCLLKIDDLKEELTEQELSLNPMEYDIIELADNVTFENGKSINISISSGDRYYYDDCYFINDDEDNYLHFDYSKPIEKEINIYHEYTDDVYIIDLITI